MRDVCPFLFSSRVFRALAALIVLAGCETACESDGPMYYRIDFEDTTVPLGGWSRRSVDWSCANDVPGQDPPYVRFLFPSAVFESPDDIPATPLLEVYSDAGRIDVPSHFLADRQVEQDCPADALYYRIGVLPGGEYLLVHRRLSAPPDTEPSSSVGAPWESFDGEDALVTTLIIDASLPPDGGVACP